MDRFYKRIHNWSDNSLMAHRKKTNKLKNPPSKWKDKLLEEGPKSFMQAILYEQLKKTKP